VATLLLSVRKCAKSNWHTTHYSLNQCPQQCNLEGAGLPSETKDSFECVATPSDSRWKVFVKNSFSKRQ
jgi:hypothetical protein